jgi:hypothetical protein
MPIDDIILYSESAAIIRERLEVLKKQIKERK